MSYSHSSVNMNLFSGKKMESEKVPNVILAFLASYPKIKGNLNAQSKKDFSAALRKIKEVKDEDVEYYAEKVEEN